MMDDLDITPPGYGTSMHYPYCVDGRCTGCVDSYRTWLGAWYGAQPQCAPAIGFHVEQCGCDRPSYPGGGV